MKNKMYKSLFVGFVVFFASCENYLDVNDSPNSPLYENIDPSLTLSAAMTQTFRVVSGNGESTNTLGNIMLNAWAGDVNRFTGAFANEYTSNITSNFYDNIWDATYRNVANFQQIVNYKSDNFDNHKAIAKIMKSFYMQTIVDLYGNAPYSQAFKGNDNLAPAYDDDKAIYRGLLAEIDEAIALFDSADSKDVVVSGASDVMNGGNLVKWRQFANTLKLRLIVRQSLLTDAETVAYVNQQAAILGALPASSFLQESLTINPGYSNANSNQQNPFYAVYGYTITGAETQSKALITPSKHVATVLNSTTDTRRSRLFNTTSNVVGIEQGSNSGGTTPTAPNNLGPGLIAVPTGVAPNLNSSIGSSASGILMTLSEVNFLIAEAAVRFPAFSSYNAQTYFNAGITSSFVRLNVGATAAASTTAANTYIASTNATSGFGWTGSANKIQAIMTQKWIALMGVNAGESWIDYVRTGFPVTPNAITNTVGKPKRLLYPASETIANSANVPAQTAASAFSDGPFWKL